jgi:hypothetical protein
MFRNSHAWREWALGGALDSILALPSADPVDPGILCLADQLLRPRDEFGYWPTKYEAFTAASDSNAYLELTEGWERIKLAFAVDPKVDAEFAKLVEVCEKERNAAWRELIAVENPQSGDVRFLLQRESGRIGTSFGGEYSLMWLIEKEVKRFYSAPAHPYFIAAAHGSLAQLQGATERFRPSPAAVEAALELSLADFEGPRLEKVAWVLGCVPAVTASVLVALSRGGGGAEALISEFLFLRLDPEKAQGFIAASGATEREIWSRSVDVGANQLLPRFTWGALLPYLGWVVDLGLRVAWMEAVARAQARAWARRRSARG